MKTKNGKNINRIFHGDAAPENIPWQVRLRIPETDGLTYSCGGTILDKTTILTAAHCVSNALKDSPNFQIFAGVVDRFDPTAQTIGIDKVFIHPDWNPGNSDIAILKLKMPLTFIEGVVQHACLPETSFEPINGETVVASGWGDTENGFDPTLQV